MVETKSMNMPKISIIVPVYKAEKYLNRCVDSILAQTFTDFELLLIVNNVDFQVEYLNMLTKHISADDVSYGNVLDERASKEIDAEESQIRI